jgi:hypothetical protein
MPTKVAATAVKPRVGFAGDILWLGVTGFVLALIMGIVCWPLSADLLPRLLAGPASDKPTSSLTPETGASVAVAAAPSGVLSVNRMPLPGTSRTTAGEVGAESSATIPTTSIAAPKAPRELGELKLSLLDLTADQAPGEHFLDHKKLALGPQPGQSASAPPPAPQPGPRRPRQNRQPARVAAPGPELVPW